MSEDKVTFPKKAKEIDISDCSDFEIMNSPIKTLVAYDEKEFGKYNDWVKLKKCAIKFNNDPKIPINKKNPDKDTHLDEALILCKISDMTIKEQGDSPSTEDFYKDNFSLTFMEHTGSSNCYNFLKFKNPDGSVEKKKYVNPSTVRIVLPKKANPNDKSDSNLDKFKRFTTKTMHSKSK